jgi:diguanylate cyclase (GGDEF)-like protein
MKDNTRTIITLGFSAVLVLMFLLIFLALNQLQLLNHSMSTLVEETNAKMEAAHAMRDAIRLRAVTIRTMQLRKDPFLRDEEWLRYMQHAVAYRSARDLLVNKPMDPRERDVHARLSAMTRISQPLNDKAARLLMNNAPAAEIEQALAQASEHQAKILGVLDELVQVEKENAEQALEDAAQHYSETRRAMFLLAALALLLGALIASIVTRSAAAKNRQIQYQANHDDLTGLLNRRVFESELRSLVASANDAAKRHALLYIDLDQFKIVNDTCGHMAGDELLCQLTSLFQEHLRKSDLIARLGGDEFGVLLRDCSLPTAIRVGETLREHVANFRFSWDSKNFSLGASIGIVPIDKSSTDPNQVLSTADMACLYAKQSGRNRVHVAHQDDSEIASYRGEMEWVGRIKEALEHDRFRLYSQKIVPTGSNAGDSEHIEILIRLLDVDGRLILPGAFLPAAERYDLMSAIDRWVIEKAIRWLEEQRSCGHYPDLAINLSGQSLCDERFLELVQDVLDRSGIDTQQICFEITETAAIANLVKAKALIGRLKNKGCRFALDDFGSGVSSFSYLKELPVDFLKIDGAFVKDMIEDPIDCAMVKSINDIGHVMNMKTIAEFAESAAIIEKLKEFGVDYAQGSGIEAPRPLEDVKPIAEARAQQEVGLAGAMEY